VNEFNIISIAPFYRNPLTESPVEALEQYTVSVSRTVECTYIRNWRKHLSVL